MLSTDAVVHELYASTEVRDAVVERWGPEMAPEGVTDRKAVAGRAFATPGDEPAAEAEAPAEEPAPAAPDAAVEALADEAPAVDEAEEPTG